MKKSKQDLQDGKAVLATYPPSIRASVKALRKLVKEVAPVAQERWIGGWRIYGYDLDGLFCYVGPFKDHAKLGLSLGIELDDPGKLLSGNAKSMRHVKVTSSKEIDHEGLTDLIEQAVELQSL